MVDPFVYLHGADGDGENDNVQAAHLVHKLKEGAREGNSACLIVQHKRKDKNGNAIDDIRGASAFVGACRSTLAFEAHRPKPRQPGWSPISPSTSSAWRTSNTILLIRDTPLWGCMFSICSE